jgi:hypothetical protein
MKMNIKIKISRILLLICNTLPKDTNGPCTSNKKELNEEAQQLQGNKVVSVDAKW